MRDAGFARNGKLPNRPSNRVTALILAVILPIFCALTTAHFEILHPVPFSLHFVAMAIIASYGGLVPGLLCVLIAVLANYLFLPHAHAATFATLILRTVIMTVSVAVISLLTRSLRRSAAALELALAKLQEQSTALIESQQASKCASWTYEAQTPAAQTYDSPDRTRWYAGGYEVFGIPFEELEKLPSPLALVLPEDQPAVLAAVRKMVAERSSLLIEYRVLWPDGELHWSEARGNPHESIPHLWSGVTFDITERKLAELALIRSEKLAAMGRLASTIAHEINNPLEAVTNLLYLARKDDSLAAETDEHLAVAERELARIGEITRLALGFIRTSAERRDVEIVDGVEDVLAIFRHRFEMKNLQIDRDYEPGITVNIAPQELRQIATNLISNALDATSPPHGRIGIRIAREQECAVLVVEDNGSGISESHLHRIFDPFFSTKEDTGTGIGLWVTRELVEKAGGTVSARSGELAGGARTSFRISFPIRVDKSRAGLGVGQGTDPAALSHPAAVSVPPAVS